MSKKQVRASQKPKYFRALDLMLASVEYTRKGMPNRAAKALADAAQDPQIDEAVDQLNQQQQNMQDADFQQQEPMSDMNQVQTSRTLARLIKASQQDDQDDQDDQDEQEQDEQDEEDEDSEETADLTEDDLSMDFGQEDQADEDEMAVKASVSSRLRRASRNKLRRD